MKKGRILLLTIGLIAFSALSWITVMRAETPTQRQEKLVEDAKAYMQDEIYVYAAPLLEEAVGIKGPLTAEAERLLKESYLALRTYSEERKYVELLRAQMGRENAPASVFLEAAEYYRKDQDMPRFFEVVKLGIEKTDDEALKKLYEAYRYQYRLFYNSFEEVTPFVGGTAKVKQNGKWGIADKTGKLLIPCTYDSITHFIEGRAIAKVGSTIYAMNQEEQRIALLKTAGEAIGVLSDDRIPIQTKDGWICATGDLLAAGEVFEELKSFQSGLAAAKKDGKWGLLNTNLEWVVEPTLEEIKVDANGFAVQGDAYFVKEGSAYVLYRGLEKLEGTYENAVPFASGEYAAVKNKGKWGFVDRTGKLVIAHLFDEAISFTGHVAPVRMGEKWGYVDASGAFVVKPVFEKAYPQYEGSAPVLTEDGWRFLIFLEFDR